MGRVYRTYGRDEKLIKILVGNPEGRGITYYLLTYLLTLWSRVLL
jgi:hypothetical protein